MPPSTQGSDPQLYARSFTDVYQAWYDDLDDPTLLVQAFVERCTPGAHVLELGSGTGRLATPLHDAGFRVTAVDASPAMLAEAAPGPVPIAADMAALPLRDQSADAALIAYNTLLNLPSRTQQRHCFAELARVLRPGSVVGIEAFIADTSDASSFGVSVREHPTDADARLVIITGPDEQVDGAIVGSHVEMGAAVVCRPWRLMYQSPMQLDASAETVGLVRRDRRSDWAGTAFDPDGHRHVSWYERI